MADSSSIDVLIIGAGPTGLMLGCQLALYPNISFRIIDENPAATTQSRALVMHARSIELFAQLDLAEKAMSKGNFMDILKGYFQGKCRFRIDLSRIRRELQPLITRYPYFLILEQSMTEQILETFLNEHHITVERNSEAIDLFDMDVKDGAGVQVTLSNGEIIRTKYVAGCDGARSIVRRKLNLQFSGRTYSESLFVVDCDVENPPGRKNEGTLFFESSGLAGMVPFAANQYRIFGTINAEQLNSGNIDFNDAVTMLKTRTRHFDMNINNCRWISIYHSHHRHISTFRCRKQYFLLGDAAHIHSPVGGQGMNTGLQDAHNLGWKLGYVLTHSANDHLLDTYHDERSPIAKSLVETTDRAFSFIASPHWLSRLVRLYIVPFLFLFIIQPLLNYTNTVGQLFFLRISQLRTTYRSSTVYDYGASAGRFHRNTPLPGDRFPYVIYDPCHYHLVIFENQQSEKVNLFVELIRQQFPEIIKIHDAQEENPPFRYEGAILVRPDGHIAYRTTIFDINHFRSYFAQFFSKGSM